YNDYVIITTSALSSYFNPIKNWLQRKGYNVSIVTTQYIDANYSKETVSTYIPNDLAAKIRNYLSIQRSNGTGWALIGGGYEGGEFGEFIVPARCGCTQKDSSRSEYNAPSDLYYSDFTGNWALDNDTLYGENGDDAVDFGPEMWVGRLPCIYSTDIQNWTRK